MGLSSRVLSQCLETDTSLYLTGKSSPGELTVRETAVLSLRQSFWKKFQDDIPPEADSAALVKFLAVNDRMKGFRAVATSMEDEYLLGHFGQEVHNFFSVYVNPFVTSLSLAYEGRMGPGSSLGANGTDFYTKLFSSNLTCTDPALYSAYLRYVSRDPRRLRAETQRHAEFGDAKIRQESTLSFVPKTRKISRTICTEPSLNMFFQLGYAEFLNRGLQEYFGINLKTQQERNKRLAWMGSKFGSFGTIDLESASDSISLGLLNQFLPRETATLLKLLRTPSVKLPNGEVIGLHMVSTMGNGFTFSLQTVLFACVVAAVYEFRGMSLRRPRSTHVLNGHVRRDVWRGGKLEKASPWEDDGNFAVYGDDIIVRKDAYRMTTRLLELLGFRVNSNKSFNDGYFRESCGADFFKGSDVRGVYVTTLSTLQSRYSVINRLCRWGARHGVKLPLTLAYLRSSVRQIYVPRWDQDDAGIHVPMRQVKGFNLHPEYQTIMYRRFVPRRTELVIQYDVGLEGHPDFGNQEPVRISIPKGLKHRILNQEGLGFAVLHGSLQQGKVSIRTTDTLYTLLNRQVGPGWDSGDFVADFPPSDTAVRWDAYMRWLELVLTR
jgi:hypothetical protein